MTTPVPIGRVVDYFLVVGHGSDLRPVANSDADEAEGDDPPSGNDNTAAAGAAAGTPQKRERSFLTRLYAGEVMARFPATDHRSVPFPEGIAMFCIPDSIRLSTSLSDLPCLYSFAATQANGHRLYGACLQFWEAVPAHIVERLEEEDRRAASSGGMADGHSTTITPPVFHDSTGSQQSYLAHRTSNAGGEGELFPCEEGSPVSRSHSPSRSPSVTFRCSLGGGANTASNAGGDDDPWSNAASSAIPFSGRASSVSGATVTSPTTTREHAPSSTMLTVNSSSTGGGASIVTKQSPSNPTRKSAGGGGGVNNNYSKELPSPASSKQRASSKQTVYAPKCICLLSLHPYLEQYRVFLTELYRASLTPSPLPLERLISNFMLEVPLPPLGQLRYRYSIANQSLYFAHRPPNNPLKYLPAAEKQRGSRLLILFELLDIENILFIWESLLNEKRILFLSNRLSTLTMITEIFLNLLFPFTWHHVYIPLLPKALIDFLCAPMPFLIGMHSSYVRNHFKNNREILNDLIIVELDKNKIHWNTGAAGGNAPQQQQQHRSSFMNQLSQLGNNNQQQQGGGDAPVHFFLPTKERRKLKEKLKPFQALFSRAGLPTSSSAAAVVPAAGAVSSSAAVSASSSSSAIRPMHQAYQLRSLSELDLAFPNAPQPSEMEEVMGYQQLLEELSPSEGDISLSFFRTFVSLFKEYREFLIYPPSPLDPVPEPCFRLKDFLKKSGYNSDKDSVNWFSNFVTTQAWQRFCEERIYQQSLTNLIPNANIAAAASNNNAAAGTTITVNAPGAPSSSAAASVLFFDESISAKRNRSKFAKRLPTPFLSDERWEIRATINVPPPETCGLPPPIEVLVGALSPTNNVAASTPQKGNSNTAATATRKKPYMFTYDTFPTEFDEQYFWGERLRPPVDISGTAANAQTTAVNVTAPPVQTPSPAPSPRPERRAVAAAINAVSAAGTAATAAMGAQDKAAAANSSASSLAVPGSATSPLASSVPSSLIGSSASAAAAAASKSDTRRGSGSAAGSVSGPIASLLPPVSSPIAVASIGASSSAAAAAAAHFLSVESLWFLLTSTLSAEFKSMPLLQMVLAALRWRASSVAAKREQLLSSTGRRWNASPPPGAASANAPSVPELTPPPEEAFLRIMRACGSCACPDVAVEIFQGLMLPLQEYAALEDTRNSGAVYTFLLSVFAMSQTRNGFEALAKLKHRGGAGQPLPMTAMNAALSASSGAPSRVTSPRSDGLAGFPLHVHGPQSPSSTLHSLPGSLPPTPMAARPVMGVGAAPLSPLPQLHLRPPASNIGAADDMSPRSPGSRRRPRGSTQSTDMSDRAASIFGASMATAGLTVRTSEDAAGARSPVPQTPSSTLSTAASSAAVPFGTAPLYSFTPASDPQACFRAAASHMQGLSSSNAAVQFALTDHCPSPQCKHALTESDIRSGWSVAGETADGSSVCPACQQRFQPRFSVRTASGEVLASGAYLPPSLLRTQFASALEECGARALVQPSFRSTSPVLLWNALYHFGLYGFPSEFLTQGMSTGSRFAPLPSATAPAALAAAAAASKAKFRTMVASPKQQQQQQHPSAINAAASTAHHKHSATGVPVTAHGLPGHSHAATMRAGTAISFAAPVPVPVPAARPAASAVAAVYAAAAATAAASASDNATSEETPPVDLSRVSFSSNTTDASDELAAELGETFSTELPLSPATAAASAAAASPALGADGQPLSAKQLHARLLSEQRARLAQQSLSPSSSEFSDVSAAEPTSSPQPELDVDEPQTPTE